MSETISTSEAGRLRDEIQKVASDLNELRRQNSSTHERLWDTLNVVKEANAVQKEQYKNILEKLNTLQSSVDALEQKPVKRYEDIVKYIVSLLIAAVLGMVFAKLGLAG